MTEADFGEKPYKSRYAVIVCPKCRQHVQITETGKKNLSCQHCGAILQARKLRVLYSSEDLSDAVAFRTCLQAEISGKGNETFSFKPFAKEDKKSDSMYEETEETFKSSKNRTTKNLLIKKDQKSIIMDILNAAAGKMNIDEFRQRALENGIGPEKFDEILNILLEAGELYFPEPGMVKLV